MNKLRLVDVFHILDTWDCNTVIHTKTKNIGILTLEKLKEYGNYKVVNIYANEEDYELCVEISII